MWLEYLTPDDLCAVYSQATALAFPSLYEGFGLPVLEGMSHGVPVACSYVSSLPELVGDAGLLVDPYDPGQLASALARLWNSPELRAELGGKAKARAKLFGVERMGRETLSAYSLAVGWSVGG